MSMSPERKRLIEEAAFLGIGDAEKRYRTNKALRDAIAKRRQWDKFDVHRRVAVMKAG
jgi:hypothetical protein